MKPIKLNKHQIEALNQGATMLLEPIDNCLKVDAYRRLYTYNDLGDKIYHEYSDISPFQPNEEYFVQEEIYIDNLKNVKPIAISAEQMQEHQSRFKFKCISVEVKRVNDLSYIELERITSLDLEDLDEMIYYTKDKHLGCKDLDNDNPYVFLYKIERIK